MDKNTKALNIGSFRIIIKTKGGCMKKGQAKMQKLTAKKPIVPHHGRLLNIPAPLDALILQEAEKQNTNVTKFILFCVVEYLTRSAKRETKTL